MALLVIGSLLQYIGTQQKSTKALVGLITIGVLWLAAVIGLALIQAHLINFAKKNTFVFIIYLILFDSFLMQLINQWTIATIYKRIQRILRWMITGSVIVLGLVIIGFFIYVRL